MKTINYKGKGEHSVNDLELIIEQQAEELHLIKSGQKPLIIDSVSQQRELLNAFAFYMVKNSNPNDGMTYKDYVEQWLSI